jgi:hypothetical protein
MKTLKALISLTGALLLVSCTQKEKNDTKSDLVRINVDLSNKTDVYDIENDIEPEWDFFALETNDDCLAGNIRRIHYRNDLYYLFDVRLSVVLVFNRNGEFVSKLDRKGVGPDDYIELSSCTVVGKNVWVAGGIDLICYDENWRAIERQRLTVFPVWDMAEQNGCIYLATNWDGHPCQLVEYDMANKQQNCLMPLPPSPFMFKMLKSSQLTSSKDGANSLFVHNFCDTVFSIGDHRITPQYRFSFSERYDDTPFPTNDEVMKPTDRIKGILGIDRMPNSIILSFLDRKVIKYAVYNEKKGTCRVYTKFKHAGLGDLISKGCEFISDDEMIWQYEPEELSEMIDELKIKNEADRQKIHTILSNAKKDDNPILFRFKWKKDAGL